MVSNETKSTGCGGNGRVVRRGVDLNRDSQPNPTTKTNELVSEPTVYLTLGDGDFTYSLDLTRYMASSTKEQPVKLILTGIDTLETLISKYKDSPSILEEIKVQGEQVPSLELSIRHGVNAIVTNPKGKEEAKMRTQDAADHVVFHHPHLGTENCAMHQRFLAHMFHSGTNYWMKENGGLFHLTLVEGQYLRWKCQEQAERHGLELLHQTTFAPPPVSDDTIAKAAKNKGNAFNNNRYHYRRHQTGKSFKTRRPNSKSITYTFGRIVDKGTYVTTHLPWQPLNSSSQDTVKKKSETKELNPQLSMLSCPFCDKTFMEKRSLKCHLRDKHADMEHERSHIEPPIKKKKLGTGDTCTLATTEKRDIPTISCTHCSRTFQSTKALEDHVRAKHSAINTYIAPDWAIAKQKEIDTLDSGLLKGKADSSNEEGIDNKYDECHICGLKLVGKNLSQHFEDFVPKEGIETFSCDFCSKPFREERAKLQHMNFCKKRPQ